MSKSTRDILYHCIPYVAVVLVVLIATLTNMPESAFMTVVLGILGQDAVKSTARQVKKGKVGAAKVK